MTAHEAESNTAGTPPTELDERANTDLEKEAPGRSSSESSPGPRPTTSQREPPNGGVRAWLVVVGATASQICTFGYIQSFGIYEQYYQANQLKHETPSNISWIGSLQLCLLFLLGMVSGPLFDRYGARVVLIPSSIIMVFSAMMTSLCKEYYQFILAQGILSGFASGMIFTPVVSAVGQYFTTRRALAMGTVVSGSSLGGVIFPAALNRLFNNSTVGFGWAQRIVGFIMLPLLIFTCLTVKEFSPHRQGAIFLPKAFKSGPYIFANIGFFTTLLGMYTPIFFLVTYAVSHGASVPMAMYMVCILNAASFIGRTSSGYFADKFGRYNAMVVSTIAAAILEFCWIATHNNAGIIMFAIVFGVLTGAVVSLYSPCIAEVTPNRSDIGTYLGMGMAFSSLAGLTGSPINGAMIEHYGDYWQAAVFSGMMTVAGAIANTIARFWLDKRVFVKV
ncbi:putative monocarboxylate transporter [Xylona heveae TC161]|uniref:Putative monocarboxylate transporter n=1 Tax=Xylona heveae (strain CBS 132557 / TC161) TaxID=1328760 RepID=A0A161TEV4_XYLHT|nr:putative monocarboxylate transporter [Xylona heveae TC161]KZF24487.1 putative monocarboxylate transporter [Xylona heveae TC161]